MSSSEIVLAPGSSRAVTSSLLDKDNQPVDFSTGSWRADLHIVEYPGAEGSPFARLSTAVEAGHLNWLTLNNSSVTITPDPDVTSLWNFHKYHYELYLRGPNVQSKPERIAHGPFRLDR